MSNYYLIEQNVSRKRQCGYIWKHFNISLCITIEVKLSFPSTPLVIRLHHTFLIPVSFGNVKKAYSSRNSLSNSTRILVTHPEAAHCFPRLGLYCFAFFNIATIFRHLWDTKKITTAASFSFSLRWCNFNLYFIVLSTDKH